MTLVRINQVQFDSDDFPPDFKPLVKVLSPIDDPIEVQHELCQTLEFSYGVPVDFVRWEPEHVRDSVDSCNQSRG